MDQCFHGNQRIFFGCCHLIFLLAFNCFRILCQFLLYNNMDQRKYTYIPSLLSFPPTPTSHPCRSSQNTKLSSPCYTAPSHQLSTLHTVVYMALLLSEFMPPSPSPAVSTVCSPCLHLYSCPEIGSSAPFFSMPYMCVNIQQCFSLSDLLHSV